VLRDVAQDVMDAELAQVAPDEMAQLLALLGESTVARPATFLTRSASSWTVHRPCG
jgi:hypothetical protein